MGHILVCAVPSPGHVSPMLAAAVHLKTIGHEVTFHTSEHFRGQVEPTGLRFIEMVGRANYDYRIPLESPNGETLVGDDHKLHALRGRFVETIPDQHERLQQILHNTPMDLVITGSMYFGALPMLLGATQKRLSVIGCGVNPMMLSSRDCGLTLPHDNTSERQLEIAEANRRREATFQPITDHMNSMMRLCGARPLPHTFFIDSMYLLPDLFLQFSAAEFEFPRSDMPDTVRFAGPLLPSPSMHFDQPTWWSELDGSRPVVLVTQGTIANQDLNELIQPTLSGLADEDVMVIAATGRTDVLTLSAYANAKVASHIPFDKLLPKVDVFITNGGYGAVNHAISLGVPMIVAGETEDKNFVAARVEWSGAGVNLKTRYPTAEQIRNAVRAILTDKAYRQAARRLQSVFARYDALQGLALAVDETLLRRRRVAQSHAGSVYTH